jgi:glycosyltransferase involved in cell wall biosynthesis
MSQEKPEKVLHCITTLDVGGAEKYLIKSLSKEEGDHQVVVLKGNLSLKNELTKINITLHCLEMNDLKGCLLAPFKFRHILKTFAPNRLIGWMYHGALFTILARFMGFSIPRFWMIRNTGLEKSYTRPLTRVLVKILTPFTQSTSLIVFNSTTSKNAHEELGWKGPFSIETNSFDTHRFQIKNKDWILKKRADLGLEPDQPVIGWVARHHPQKGPDEFLSLAFQLKNQLPNVQFITLGKGLSKTNPKWKTSLKQAGILDHTIAIDAVSDLENWYPLMDVMVLTSKDESFPNVLGEAQACGVNCVSFEVGDAHVLIHDSQNLIPNGHVQKMLHRVKELLSLESNDRTLSGHRARAHIKANHADSKEAPHID